jgi:hypothetical protein
VRLSRDWKLWTYLAAPLAFVVAELAAVASRRRGDTASERVWALPRPARWAVGLVSLGLGVWLSGHFAFGWWS